VLINPKNILLILLIIFIISFIASYIFTNIDGNDIRNKSSLPDYGEAYSDHGF
tara:strand:- start:100 stop:258 length:159 start_codon:yes stop_codon:yes gene_type:complete